MILTKETFTALWYGFVEQPQEENHEQSAPEITNGVSDGLAALLTACANGDDTCFADEFSPV